MDEAIVSAIAGLRTRIADLERLEFSITGSHGGAPADAQYVTMALNATLTQERILTAGILLGLTDGGAGGAATLDVELHHVIRVSNTATYEYAASDAGLAAANAAAAVGDIIRIAPGTYTGNYTFAAGATVFGLGGVILSGQITLGISTALKFVTIPRTATGGTLISLIGPTQGEAWVYNCSITATNSGGIAYGVQVGLGNLNLVDCFITGTGSTTGYGIYNSGGGRCDVWQGHVGGSTAPSSDTSLITGNYYNWQGMKWSYSVGSIPTAWQDWTNTDLATQVFGTSGQIMIDLGAVQTDPDAYIGMGARSDSASVYFSLSGSATAPPPSTLISDGPPITQDVNFNWHEFGGLWAKYLVTGYRYLILDMRNGAGLGSLFYVHAGTIPSRIVYHGTDLSEYLDTVAPDKNAGSAWDTVHFPTYHDKGTHDGAPTIHVPPAGTAGNIVVDDGAKWVSETPATAGIISGTGTNKLAKFTAAHTIADSGVADGVTAGKVLTLTATDDYNVTIPATGTVAELAIANIFTRKQTITGSADEVQLTVTGFTTQSTGAAVEKIARNDTAAGISPVLDLVGLGSGAAGDGISLRMLGKSSTTAERALAAILADWYNPTDASRVSEIVFDTFFGANPLEALRLRGNNALVGSALLVGSNSVVNNSLLAFNGTNTNVNTGDLTELNSAATFSISFWVNETVVPAVDNLYVKSLGTNDRIQAAFSTTSNRLFVYVCNGSNSFGQLDNYDTYIVAGRWHHIVVVYDGGGVANADRLKLYIDGNYVAFTSFNGTIPATTSNLATANFLISSSSNSIEGLIKRLRVYNIPITAGNVTTLYQGIDFSTNLVHYYKLDEGVGTVAYDTGSNPMNGTIGAGSWTTSGYSGLGTTFPTTRLALYASTTRDGGISFGNDTWFYRSAAGTLTLNGLGYTALIAGSNGSAATLGLFGVAAIARPTTAIAAAAFVQNSGNAINDASTIGGYTLLQVVKALQNLGALT